MTKCRLCGADAGLPSFYGGSIAVECRACVDGAPKTAPSKVPIGAEVKKVSSPARVRAMNAARKWENAVSTVVGRAEGARF